MNLGTRIAGLFLLWTFFANPTLAQADVPDFLIDLNGDGEIGSQDLLILLHRWGVSGIPTPVPSPTTNPNLITVNLPFPTPVPIQLIRIPPGTYTMGSPDTERSRVSDEGPNHLVTISNAFFMGRTEVTQAQWEAVMGSQPAADFGEGDNFPVYSVSWLDCQDFLLALNTLSGEGNFRLPTEAEWEYACRGRTTKRFYFGNSLGCADGCEDCKVEEDVIGGGKRFPWESIDSALEFQLKGLLPSNLKRSDFMWYCANSGIIAQRVRSLRSNAFGLFDMAGNVHEWVQDEYHSDYSGATTDGSAWIGGGNGQRVQRGGAFVSSAGICRSAKRLFGDPSSRSVNTGFRIVWTP